MALDADSRESLREWLVRILEPLCDAEPSVLSKYVLALVQANPAKEGLEELCRNKLREFLGDETNAFVDRLFKTLRTKAYLQKSSSPRHDAPLAQAPSTLPLLDTSDGDEQNHRRGRDDSDVDVDGGRSKRPRRSRSRSPPSLRDAHRSHDRRQAAAPYSREPRRDQGRVGGGGRGNRGGPRGYDQWGSLPPHMQSGGGGWGPMYPRPMYPPMLNPDAFDPNAYDPDSPSMHPPFYPTHHHPPPPHNHRGRPDKPTFTDSDSTTLRVENVDAKFINMVKLSGHFSRFGDVVNVQMRPEFRAAFVQFATPEAARKAFHSPMPVCNNRFIAVKFAKRSPKDLGEIDVDADQTPEALRAAALETGKKILEEKRQLVEQDKALLKQRQTLLTNQLSQHQLLREKMLAKGLLSATEQPKVDAKIAALKAELDALTQPPPNVPLATLQAELSQLEAKAKAIRRGGGGGSIDNRTKVVQVTGIPPALRDVTALTQHFATYGSIVKVRLVEDVGYVQFADRYGGEKVRKIIYL
ncbi:hypothetical protein, variant [Aphanomyces astaci]|uniref:RRM domain-containing protein n=1 Tax=Aphanomyces astaci TaxID=112090 RepID=W4FHG1_APHAT|nr:hypothetical protein, variant [Aphanomyces astaci]ETV66261.1 hypothetical protein, variant [Aphanomyces astaci]|eukprot:XP_009844247.1 hypothetical protein, variant [Aphanomyces astaci]